MELIPIINDSLSSLAKFAPIVQLFGATGIVLTCLPKIGFGRALRLGFGSLLPSFSTKSLRTKDVAFLKSIIRTLSHGNYIIVTGGKGIGKTCLINTSVDCTLGVVKVGTQSGESKDVIIQKTLREITNIRLIPSTPIVVINVPECHQNKEYAEVTGAIRSLAEDFKLRVIADVSPNSIPPDIINTKRENIINLDFMDKNVIESIPEFKELIDFLKSHKLDHVVYAVLGGCPSDYIRLDKYFGLTTGTAEEKIQSIKGHIEMVLTDALVNIVRKCSRNTEKIIKLLRRKRTLEMPVMDLKAKKLLLYFPNKVFREVSSNVDTILAPANPAIGLIIKHNIKSSIDVAAFVVTQFP